MVTYVRQLISPLADSPVQLMGELRRFRRLLSRPTIRKSLVQEREALLHQLLDLLEGTGESFESFILNVTHN